MRHALRIVIKVIAALVLGFVAFAIAFILSGRHFEALVAADKTKGDGQVGMSIFVHALNIASVVGVVTFLLALALLLWLWRGRRQLGR